MYGPSEGQLWAMIVFVFVLGGLFFWGAGKGCDAIPYRITIERDAEGPGDG